MFTIYAFECKGIQHYILGNRLRYMVGGSEIVEQLTHDGCLLDQSLDALKLHGQRAPAFARRAGGAFRALFLQAHDAERFRDLWTFLVRSQFPGLSFVHALASGESLPQLDTHIDTQLRKDRNRGQLPLPAAAPYAARSPRTGLPASQRDRFGELLDAATAARALHSGGQLLDRKLQPDPQHRYHWPRAIVPEREEDKQAALFPEGQGWAAVIHADGNGLGKILHQVRAAVGGDASSYAPKLRAFSDAVNGATLAAVRRAAALLVKPQHSTQAEFFVAARPLVVGGDDLTLIVRAEDALNFTEAFLTSFETETRKAFAKLDFVDQSHMTACAGIAFIKAEQPFQMAYRLAESLCRHAKTRLLGACEQGGPACSALAFHRITTSIINDYPTILETELKRGSLTLSLQPYAVGDAHGPAQRLPLLSQLLETHNVLQQASRGSLREIARLAQSHAGNLEHHLRRWTENMQKQPETASCCQLIQESFAHLLGLPADETLHIARADGCSPLGDLLALRPLLSGECHD